MKSLIFIQVSLLICSLVDFASGKCTGYGISGLLSSKNQMFYCFRKAKKREIDSKRFHCFYCIFFVYIYVFFCICWNDFFVEVEVFFFFLSTDKIFQKLPNDFSHVRFPKFSLSFGFNFSI